MKLKAHHNVEASPSESSSSKKSLKRSLLGSLFPLLHSKSLCKAFIFSFAIDVSKYQSNYCPTCISNWNCLPAKFEERFWWWGLIFFLWNLKSFHKTFNEGCPHYPELPSNESFPNERNWFPCGISPVRCLSDYVTHQTLKCRKLFKMLRNLSWEVVTRQVQWLPRL